MSQSPPHMARALNVRLDFLMADMGWHAPSARQRADELKRQIRPAWMVDLETPAQGIRYYTREQAKVLDKMKVIDIKAARALVERYTTELETNQRVYDDTRIRDESSIIEIGNHMASMNQEHRTKAANTIRRIRDAQALFKTKFDAESSRIAQLLEDARSDESRYESLFTTFQEAEARIMDLKNPAIVAEFRRTRQAWVEAAERVPPPTERETIEEYDAKFKEQQHTPYDNAVFSFYYEVYAKHANNSQYQTARQWLINFISTHPIH